VSVSNVATPFGKVPFATLGTPNQNKFLVYIYDLSISKSSIFSDVNPKNLCSCPTIEIEQ
jgi:hypothetical protein